MGLFNKKNEELQEEIQIEEDNKKSLSRTIRRVRKKKEPIQPWTKKERLIILGVLVFTVLMSAILGLSAREWTFPELSNLKLQLPNLFQGTIVLESESKVDNKQGIVSEFEQITKNLSGKYGFYYKDLTTNQIESLYVADTFQAASMIKVPVMISLYQHKPIGYKDLVVRMGKNSDNAAFREARKILGDKTIEDTISDIGMTKTNLVDNETSLQDMALIFEDLYLGKILTKRESAEILSAMEDTIYENHLAAGIPEEIRVSHKYGREVHVVNDGGIVYADKPYLVIIMSKGVVESEADEYFSTLSNLIYTSTNH